MKKLNINIDKGGYQEKNGVTKFVPFPDVRPLSERVRKRTPSKKFDPKQGLLFDNSMRNCIGYIPSHE